MDRLRRTAIGLLLVVVGVRASGATKPASVLLQEALYAEEIEGDLDAAIKIYEQVVREGEEAQKAAAQAAYRIGMCYLKKGDKPRAAEQFGEVISKYPDEERVVARARRELSKLTPAAPEGLGAARELVIYSEETGKGFFFDIDSGESFSPPVGLTRGSPPSEVIAWCRSKGIDLVNDGGHLELLEMTVVEVREEMWDSGDAAEVGRALAAGPRKEVLRGHSRDYTVGSAVTYAFESREGGTGLLQVLGSRDKDVRIRYKILGGASVRPAGLGFGRVRTAELFDIDDPEVADRPCAANLDNDRVLIIPEEVRERGNNAVKMWLGKGKADVVAEIASDGGGLIGIQMAVKELPGRNWTSISAAALRRLMSPGRAVVRETSEMAFEGGRQRPVFAFRTAEGTYGVLRILDVSESRHIVKFEYKRVQEVSLETLKVLGVAGAMYANEHGDRLPASVEMLKPYVRERDFEWIVANVEYVGAGMRMDASVRNVVTAYDRTLLGEGNGTNVLFGDGHVESVGPEQVEKLGIVGSAGGFSLYKVMKAEVYDNGVLDLETGAVLTGAERGDGPLKFYDVGWDNDGGGALMVVPGSSARILALASAKNVWDACAMARDSVSLVRASPSRGFPAAQSRFAAVLTDGGKLAVVGIVEHEAKKGVLLWWFQGPLAPAFSPSGTVSLVNIVDERAEMKGVAAHRAADAFDFDTGRILQIPEGMMKGSRNSILEWALNAGVDAIGGIDDRKAGLGGIGTVFERLPHSEWHSIRPEDLGRVADKTWRRDGEETVTCGKAEKTHPIYGFRTFEGGLGIVQLLEIDRSVPAVTFRYSLLRNVPKFPMDLASGAERRREQAEKLRMFGKMMLIYANDHGDKFPDNLGELRETCAQHEGDFEWIVDNVAYVAKGKTAGEVSPRGVAAYDVSLLRQGEGTNVLFFDLHVEFVGPAELGELGIVPERPGAAQIDSSDTATDVVRRSEPETVNKEPDTAR